MPEVVLKNLPFLLAGLRVTAEIAALSIVGGTVLGLAIGTLRYLRVPLLAPALDLYVAFIRGTPLLMVLFICYFALPALLGYKTSAYSAAAFGFIAFIAAYLAEDIRAGLRSVKPGLMQAALATGLTRAQALRLVIVPIALRNVIPTLFSQYVRLLKFTSVASVIGVNEFTGSAMLVNGREFAPITIIGFIALTYLAICFLLSAAGRVLYARLAVRT
ncbi:MAG TPA: amino acid ABC transporter permease [Xanthobacteraceae bacterium]|nr:amino acid ABC transporter permease [Xanthobacteraceae bacterium]